MPGTNPPTIVKPDESSTRTLAARETGHPRDSWSLHPIDS